MSKYIRTKDGRILETKTKEETASHLDSDWVSFFNGSIRKKCIVKQADKLEDLLDEYVIVNNADEKPFRLSVSVAKELEQRDETGNTICQGTSEYLFDLAKSKLENLKKFVGNKKKHDKCVNYLYEENPDFVFEGTIKGAIWTKKGLIYVADINENGDLCLQ